MLAVRAGCFPFSSYAEPFHSLFVYRFYGVVPPTYHFSQGGKGKGGGYLSRITPNFFKPSRVMPRKRITIAHQANPPRVTENPFANLFSDLLISDLVVTRLVGGPERQTAHFVGGDRMLWPFSE